VSSPSRDAEEAAGVLGGDLGEALLEVPGGGLVDLQLPGQLVAAEALLRGEAR
jgi:hypothetical protein